VETQLLGCCGFYLLFPGLHKACGGGIAGRMRYGVVGLGVMDSEPYVQGSGGLCTG